MMFVANRCSAAVWTCCRRTGGRHHHLTSPHRRASPTFSPPHSSLSTTTTTTTAAVPPSDEKPRSVSKSEIAREIARAHDLSIVKSQRILNTVLDTIVEAVDDDRRVTLQHFGTFDCYMSKERTGVNPSTKEKISIPSKRRVRFKASGTFKKTSTDTDTD